MFTACVLESVVAARVAAIAIGVATCYFGLAVEFQVRALELDKLFPVGPHVLMPEAWSEQSVSLMVMLGVVYSPRA